MSEPRLILVMGHAVKPVEAEPASLPDGVDVLHGDRDTAIRA